MARDLCTAILLAALSMTASTARGAANDSPPPGTATLPLSELRELQRARDDAQRPQVPPPPVRATVNRLEIGARLLDGGLDATAQVEVTILGGGWVSVPLLDVRASTQLTSLPAVDGGVLALVDGRLCLVTDQPGAHAFSLHWLERASAAARGRSAEIRVPPGSPAVLKLDHDQTLFQLTSGAAHEEGAGAVLYPAGGRILVTWQRIAPVRAQSRAAARPPVEPVVSSAHASVVATLEGRRITRVQYALRFEGQKTFAVTVPSGQSVERVFLNGTARPFTLSGDELSLPVEAARAGDQTATVELVTSESERGYALSGSLAFTLPRPRWGTNDLHATLHLPAVFDYRWSGGSLALVAQSPSVDYAWDIPTPGAVLALHQQLVSSFPTVQVGYTVNLTSSYYR